MHRRVLRSRIPVVVAAVAAAASLSIGWVAPADAAPAPAASHSAAAAMLAQVRSHTPLVGKPVAPTSTYSPADCNRPVPANTARCFALVSSRTNKVTPQDGPVPGSLGPAEIQDAYGLPAGGTGQTVAIVDAYGYSTAESDLAVFRQQYHLPACTTANGCFTKVNQRGVKGDYPVDDGGWSIESALDLDAVSSACPACKLLLVEGDSASLPDLAAAVDTAVRLGAKYVSNSYGVPGETPEQSQFDSSYTHPGVAITVSTGDTGNEQEWPSTNPNVIAVAGTTLNHASNPRGWTETAWADGGSGCSLYEAKPAYQDDVRTSCDKRAVGDISAVADPDTGLSVYNTLGDSGWSQYGGTSLSSPLVAAMYALSGPPARNSNPVTSLYSNQGVGLTDVTDGSNGTCGNVLCIAGAGWDGPTGWGTPYGVSGLTTVPHGVLSGTVTSSGHPVADVTITFSDGSHTFTAITDAQGRYSVNLPAGTYSYDTSVYNYEPAHGTGVTITVGQTSTKNITLTLAPQTVLSGTVKDGSGHGWPLYAKITVDGYPGGPVYTDPFTGAYSVPLPGDHTYAVHTEPIPTGYASVDSTVRLTRANAVLNVAPEVTPQLNVCQTAPGYGYAGCENFDGWTRPQDGWSITPATGTTTSWTFSDLLEGFYTGEGEAAVDLPTLNDNKPTDAYLTSPAYDLTNVSVPRVAFNYAQGGGTLSVEYSLDRGASWKKIWSSQADNAIGQSVNLGLPGAAGHTGVRVRVHYVAPGNDVVVALDNLTVGPLAEQGGALVAGITRDALTGKPINPATVTDKADPSVTTTSRATPDDPRLGDGYYSVFEPHVGPRVLTTSALRYATATNTVSARPDALTRFDPSLQAGRLAVDQNTIKVTQTLGGSTTTSVTVKNTGTTPLHVTTSEQEAGFTPLQHPGAEAATAGNSWQALPDLPQPALDNAVGSYRGNVYSFAGVAGLFSPTVYDHNWVYKPATGAWTRIADAPAKLVSAQGTFVDGVFYLVGGARADRQSGQMSVATTYAYHPDTDTWTTVAPMPTPLARSAVTGLDNKLYVVGGCLTVCSKASSAAFRYDPATDKWTALPNYPLVVSFASCGGLALVTPEVVCAGGITYDAEGHVVTHADTYAYRPGVNRWVAQAAMPATGWAMASANSGGQFQVANGTTENFPPTLDDVRHAYQFDPVHNAWSMLPVPLDKHFRGGGACGFYNIGGDNDPGSFFPSGGTAAEVLPGYDQCGTDDVNWVYETNNVLTLQPGASAKINVTVDSSALTAPGTYRAQLDLITDAPYTTAPINVVLVANPPASWGLVAGTVTDASTHRPLANSTVTVCTHASNGTCGQTYTLHTDADGNYSLWLDSRNSPLLLTVTANGYQPASRSTTLRAGQETDLAFALTPSTAKSTTRTPTLESQAAGIQTAH